MKDLHAAGFVGTYDAAVVTKDSSGKVHVNNDEMATRHGGWRGPRGGLDTGDDVAVVFVRDGVDLPVAGGSSEDVALVDLTTLAIAYYKTVPNLSALFATPTEGTHFSESGATQIASLVAGALKSGSLPLSSLVK